MTIFAKPMKNIMKNFKHTSLIALSSLMSFGGAAVVLTALTPPVAEAQSSKAIVDGALSKGLIGETVSGYLAPVDGAVLSQGVRNAMNEINIGRKSVYTRLAREQNLSVEVVAALTGEKQIAKAPAGQKVLDRSGAWRTK